MILHCSAGGVIEAIDHVIDEKVNNAYALVRPPGHHAMPNKAMGFCIFGNAAIAYQKAHSLDPEYKDVATRVHHNSRAS